MTIATQDVGFPAGFEKWPADIRRKWLEELHAMYFPEADDAELVDLKPRPPRARLPVRGVVRRLEEHRLAVFLLAAPADQPEMTSAAAGLGRLSGRRAQARLPADALRHPPGH